VEQARCPNCGQPVPDGARFCPACGTTLAARVDAAERRVVTAIFADLAGSTRLGEQLDAEILRAVVSEFFEIAGREIRGHGGSVEQFSGDAAVGIFGLTSSHEDDAERAVRTAMAIVKAIGSLQAAVREQHRVGLDVHIGIESGEAVSGDPFAGGTSVTGDALNVAARLEKSAAPGQILVGPTAYAATKHAIAYEPIGDLALAGKSLPVAAYQPIRFLADIGEARGLGDLKAPLLGRDEEMLQLLDTAERLNLDRKALLFTILGPPGIGKSRLAREAGDRLAARGWRVLRGRCLPYGEGITYWPVAEMARRAAGITAEMGALEAVAHLVAATPDAAVSDRLAFAIGLTRESPVSGGGIDREIAWAFRRWVQAQAMQQPLLLVFEDIHWAEPALLDLIEYLATWSGDVPVLILCLSRPELLDKRPSWGAGRFQASRITLQPLSRQESAALVGALLNVEGLPDKLRSEMLERADGNPLFVEELIRMLLDDGTIVRDGDRWTAAPNVKDVQVPHTVEALIRARLDTLPRPERTALQAGAVIGRSFERQTLEELLDDQLGLDPVLENLVLRDLISEEAVAGDQATYRFKHILVRDVAYGTLPKSRRAALHSRVAQTLQGLPADRATELVEIRAYHLEEAVKLESELRGKASDALHEEATAALEASARSAVRRGDNRAALVFTERCLALGPEPAERRLDLECLLLDAEYNLGRLQRAREVGIRIEIAARALGRKDLEGRAILAQARAIWVGDPEGSAEKALNRLAEAEALLREAGDLRYLYETLYNRAFGGWWFGNLEQAWAGWSEAREIARKLGDKGREARACTQLGGVRYHQGRVSEAKELRRQAVEFGAEAGSRTDWALATTQYGFLVGIADSIDEGLRLSEGAVPAQEEAGDLIELAASLSQIGRLYLFKGSTTDALPNYKRALELSEEIQETGYRPELERHLAHALLELGDLAGAVAHAEAGVRIVADDDWVSISNTKMVLGLVCARQGRSAEAETLLRDAVAVLERTDYVAARWEHYLALSEFLLAQGRQEEAREWMHKTRAITALHGEHSPLAAYVEGRLAAVTATRR
jgi:class 3 adenylate cyclase/tetratricopeptide (TPR) repeat protein